MATEKLLNDPLEDDNVDLDEESLMLSTPERPSKDRWGLWRFVVQLTLGVVLLSIGVAIGRWSVGNERQTDKAELELYKDFSFPVYTTTYNGSFYHRTRFGRKPSPDVDAAWGRYTEAGSEYMPADPPLLAVSASDAASSTQYPLTTVVRTDELGQPGYLAAISFFHELHCLNMVRRLMDFDYYAEVDPAWAGRKLVREHGYHCIDMLREMIMCRGDTHLITYHWVKGFSAPVPDFSTTHSCHKADDLLEFTKANALRFEKPMEKYPGAPELPTVF